MLNNHLRSIIIEIKLLLLVLIDILFQTANVQIEPNKEMSKRRRFVGFLCQILTSV